MWRTDSMHKCVQRFHAARWGWLAFVRVDWMFVLSQLVLGNIMYILWSIREYRWVCTEVCLPKMGLRWNRGAYFRTLQMVISASFNFLLSQVCWSDRRHWPFCTRSISGDHNFWNQFVWLATDKVALVRQNSIDNMWSNFRAWFQGTLAASRAGHYLCILVFDLGQLLGGGFTKADVWQKTDSV